MASPYIVSALKHRPKRFDEVLAQEHVTRTLIHSLQRGQIANAFLFAGPRGTGKTTTARILAKALNCENRDGSEPCNQCDSCISISKGTSPDILEIDAASNRGIDEIKELRDNARFTPVLSRFKIFIIDECHMLTDAANNALLKTLEEPPTYTRFIFATTELHKILPTILSRCQRFQFRRIPVNIIVDHLKHIFNQQNDIEIADPAELDRILFHIARSAEGGLRDALVSLDQLIGFCSGKLNLTEVEEILGVIEFDSLDRFIRAIIHYDLESILVSIEQMVNQGREISWYLRECIQYLRNLAVVKITSNYRELLDLPEEYCLQLKETSDLTTIEQILYITDVFWDAAQRMRGFSAEGRLILEMYSIKAAKAADAVKVTDLLKQLSEYSPASNHNQPSKSNVIQINKIQEKSNEPSNTTTETLSKSNPVQEYRLTEPIVEKDNNSHATAESNRIEPSSIEPVSAPAQSKPQSSGLLASTWDQLLHEMEEKNSIIAGALNHSVPIDIENDTLKIAIPAQNGFASQLLQKPRNKQNLETIVKQYYGKPLKVVFETREGLIQTDEGENTSINNSTSAVSKRELMNKVEDNEVFNMISESLPGRILDIKPEPKT